MPALGLGAFLWFLIRVVPKPSRAAYPCQRVAFPLASGFLVWLLGCLGATLAFRKARHHLYHTRYLLGGLCVVAAILSVWFSLSILGDPATGSFVPSEGANNPMGVAKGIYPGRVVWSHNALATSWNGIDGYWWEDAHSDQYVVDMMLSKTLCELTGEDSDAGAWEALFKYYNQEAGKGDVGYQSGEQIVIKINMNNSGTGNTIDASPQIVRGILRQLVHQAHIDQTAITVYDAIGSIGSPVYNACYPEFPEVKYLSNSNITWIADAITYSAEITNSNARRVPACVINAEYLINMAILKRHNVNAAVTLCAKNHFGTIGNPYALHPYVHHWERGMGTYDPQVDLMGCEHIGAKTILYIIDGLYGASGWGTIPIKWTSTPFNEDWPSSIFVSQDPVAVDSVGMDFLRAEWALLDHADNYLHEAAQADNPPSGIIYDPENDETGLSSQGVHEHWNNNIIKQYSRNLGTGDGIELITNRFIRLHPADLNYDNKVDIKDYCLLASFWETQNEFADMNGDLQINAADLNVLSEGWLWNLQDKD
ncbi:DUF362 domain-containing protein [Planctomycetota bacterium]